MQLFSRTASSAVNYMFTIRVNRMFTAAVAAALTMATPTAFAADAPAISPASQFGKWCALDEESKCGLVNGEGRIVIPTEYDDVGVLASDGSLAVKKGEKWGVIDRQNKVLIDFKFDDLGRFSKNGLAAALRDEKWGYINRKGDWAIEPRFDSAHMFTDFGTANIEIDEKFGIIDEQGNYLAKPIYDSLGRLEPGPLLARATRDDKAGYLNEKGQEQIAFTLEEGYAFSVGGYAIVRTTTEKDKYAYNVIDTQGKALFSKTFDGGYVCDESDLFLLLENDRWGFMSKDGQWQIKPTYDDAKCFTGASQLAAVRRKKGKWGFINTKNQFVIQPGYDDVESFNAQGFAGVSRNKKWGYVTMSGKTAVPLRYARVADGDEPNDLMSVEDYYVNSRGQVITDASHCGTHITMLDGKVTWPVGYVRDQKTCKQTTAPTKNKASSDKTKKK